MSGVHGHTVAGPAPAARRRAERGGSAGPSHLTLVRALEREIERVLDPLIPADRPVALLDFPDAPNVGDSMIWAGTLRYLARRRLRVRYTCSNFVWSRRALARRIGDGTILLTGGGNFGDLYPDHQELREAVLESFPRHRIVQLPQSVRFESAAALDQARRVVAAHPGFTLLVRDQVTLAFAQQQFDAPVALCPDMAFALGALPRTPAVHPVVWLARTDKESRHAHVTPPPGVERVDWLTDDPSPAGAVRQVVRRMVQRWPRLHVPLQAPLSAVYPRLAAERVERGRRLLCRGRVVVSDRLHAHVLCVLLGIPHLVLDNTYGKVRALFDTWTCGSPLATWCADEAEALERAVSRAAAMEGDVGD